MFNGHPSLSRPLRLTIVQGAFLPVPPLLGGAVEKAWAGLGLEFARQGHQVLHASRAYPDLPANETVQGVRHHRVRGYTTPRALWRLKLLDLAYSLRVRAALPPADVLVTHTFWLPLVERRPSRGRLYVHVGRYPKGQMRLYPQRAILQTVSDPIRAAILREVPAAAGRVAVLPYPLSPTYLVPRGPARPVLLYTGRLHPEKGVHLLIAAFRRLSPAVRGDWTLRIIGPWRTAQGGAGAAYREELQTAAAGAPVEMLEPIFDETALVRQYREAAVFVYPSLAERGETFGLSVLEAMAAGCAPIVSALGCFGDFVHDGRNGRLFDHRAADPVAALTHALADMIAPSGPREALRAAAWLTARDYALPAIARRYLDHFQSLVAPATTAPLFPCLSTST